MLYARGTELRTALTCEKASSGASCSVLVLRALCSVLLAYGCIYILRYSLFNIAAAAGLSFTVLVALFHLTVVPV